MSISWPGHIKDLGGIRNQFCHMIDVVPTLLEVCGIPVPEEVDGIKQKPIEGVSFAYTFDEKNAKEASRHKTHEETSLFQGRTPFDGAVSDLPSRAGSGTASWLLARELASCTRQDRLRT
jgi:arylsulfatase